MRHILDIQEPSQDNSDSELKSILKYNNYNKNKKKKKRNKASSCLCRLSITKSSLCTRMFTAMPVINRNCSSVARKMEKPDNWIRFIKNKFINISTMRG